MRSRITITISEDLLQKVDQAIDGHSIRNRSQAIETLLRQVVEPKINTAVILAGGPGTKLKDHKGKPAALIPINSGTIIEHTISHLHKFGIQNIIICLNKSDNQIKKLLGDGSKYSINITYSEESEPLGTGGALKKAAKLIPDQPFLVIHSDLLTDINIDEFIDFHNQNELKATVAIKPRPGKMSYGRVFIQGSKVVDFQEPKKETAISLVNTGIYLFDHSCLKMLPKQKTFQLEDTLIPQLIKDQQISAYTFQGIWYDVTDPKDYEEAKGRWKNR